jgi:hypothetical protein
MWGPRIPFGDEVLVFDKKIQYLSAAATDVEIGGNDRVIIDYYVLWQIDPSHFAAASRETCPPPGPDPAQSAPSSRVHRNALDGGVPPLGLDTPRRSDAELVGTACG